MKDDQVTKDLAMIARNAINHIIKLERQVNELKRKPLTTQQILDLFDSHNVYGSKWVEFARAIERAHGIGGNNESA